jgi:Inner membrane protein YgaP-like, transmembrane domain
MIRNVTAFDRAFRLIVGILILGLYGALDAPWRYVTLVGLIPLGSALTGFCPLYAALGWNRILHPGRRT